MTSQRPAIGLRERKKQQTRQRLVDAAFALFEDHGYDNVSAAEIAERADVSERTFFRYFPTKEDVIFPDADEQQAHLEDLLADLPADTTVIEGLRAALQTLGDEYRQAGQFHLTRARLLAATPSLHTTVLQREQQWVDAFAMAIADRMKLDRETDLRPELTAAVLIAAFRVVMNHWIHTDGQEDMHKLLDDALIYVGQGLAP